MANLVDPGLPAPNATSQDDTMLGTQFADVLNGGAGNDIINGNGGRDWIDGEAGRDALTGGAGDDLLYGWDGEDTLDGGGGGDFLFGEAGMDTLLGGPGDDVLVGGLDPNVYIFGADSDVDHILDFEPGTDRISIEAGTAGIATPNDALARVAADMDGTAVLDLGGGNSVVLIGVAASQVTVEDFSILTAG